MFNLKIVANVNDRLKNYVDYFQLQFYCFCFYLSLLRDIVTKLSLQKACSKIQ